MSNTILTETKNDVRILTLNRPRRLNALNEELLGDFSSALDDANADDRIGAIVLCGSGSSFCSGDDLKEFGNQSGDEEIARAYIESIQDITRKIVLGRKVVVGAIHGWAVGGGLEWAINCDFAVFAENARCFFPESRWGMFPTGGVTTLLPRMVGLVKARELLMLGTEFGASEALEMGLAWKVVSAEEVFDVARQLAEQIAALPRTAIQELKRTINRVGAVCLEEAIQLETEATVRTFLDPETAVRVGQFDKKQ